MAARRNGSGETLNREKRSGKVIQKKHGGRKFCAQPKAGSTVVEGGTSEKILFGSVKKFVSLEENDSFLVRITI